MKRCTAGMESTKVRAALSVFRPVLMCAGTWVPLERGEELANRNGIYERLRTIFEFVPGDESPPPAPKHTTSKPKNPRRPAVPRFNSSESFS